MWYCTRCGTANEGMFCVNCGNAKSQEQPVTNNQVSAGMPMQDFSKASEKKSGFKSPLFIAAALCAVVGLFFTFISWFMPSAITNLIYTIRESMINADIYDSEIDYILRNLMYGSTGLKFLYVLLNIIINIPTILCGIGLVLALCGKENNGISLIKGGIITSIVYLSISLFLMLLGFAGIFISIGSYSYYYMSGIVAGLIIGAVIVIAIYVLSYIYYAHLLSILKIARAGDSSDTYTKNPSLYVAVMNIIGGGLSALLGLIAMISDANITNFASLVSSVGLLLFGILIISRRNTQSKVSIEAPASAPEAL